MSEAHPFIHNHHHHCREMSVRSIHFAPLPDPRLCHPRDDDTDDDDDDPVELDAPESSKNAKTLFQFSLSGGRRPSDTSSIASSSMHSLTPTQSIDSTTQPSRKSRFLRLFKSKDKVRFRLLTPPLADAIYVGEFIDSLVIYKLFWPIRRL